MDFESSKLAGAYVIRMQKHTDERGYFARTWCLEEFLDQGIDCSFVQSSVSFNTHANTLRGMHLQTAPHGEAKLIRCLRGAVYDVILDLRKDSDTYLQWQAVEMTQDNGTMLFVPEGFAHGFQTLVPNTELSYHITEFYAPDHATGVRWDDPAFAIDWPEAAERTIAAKDREWPDFDPSRGLDA